MSSNAEKPTDAPAMAFGGSDCKDAEAAAAEVNQAVQTRQPRRKLSILTPNTCSWCGGDGATKKCRRCKWACYCGRPCQESDWDYGTPVPHKEACVRYVVVLISLFETSGLSCTLLFNAELLMSTCECVHVHVQF